MCEKIPTSRTEHLQTHTMGRVNVVEGWGG